MRRAIALLPNGSWSQSDGVGEVTLTYADRYRRRRALTDGSGAPFLLDLPRAVRMRDGDGLALDDGGVLRVGAAAEAVVDLACADPATTTRLAWHIGNRHIPLQVLVDGHLRILDDHVIVAMAEGLGATAERRMAPFAPEAGAYESGEHHAHEHERAHHPAHDHAS